MGIMDMLDERRILLALHRGRDDSPDELSPPPALDHGCPRQMPLHHDHDLQEFNPYDDCHGCPSMPALEADVPFASQLSPSPPASIALEEALKRIKHSEDASPDALADSMHQRAQALSHMEAEPIKNALYHLLDGPPLIPSLSGLAHLAVTLHLSPCRETTVVDPDGNPYTEYILTFIDTFLVLYAGVDTAPVNLIYGSDRTGENDETDQKAFGALTATALAPRVLILIPHAHHHVLRALWFALTYLATAYHGSKRGVAVDFLIGAISEEWVMREERARGAGRSAWQGLMGEQLQIEEEWMRRARKVNALRKSQREAGGLSLSVIWAEMKGISAFSQDNIAQDEARSPKRIKLDIPRTSASGQIHNPMSCSSDDTPIYTPNSHDVTEPIVRMASGIKFSNLGRGCSLSPDDE